MIQEQVDRLYANLKDENTNKSRVAETLNTLDYIFKVDKSASVRLLARVVLKMYRAVTDLYMNACFGLGMKQADRAELGEQFHSDVKWLISDTSSRSICVFSKDIRYSALSAGSAAAISLRSPETRCIAGDCRLLRRKNNKAVYREKCSEGVFNLRQRVKYSFENFMHKKKGWNRLSRAEKAEYRALHDEFVARSAEMLKEYERSGAEDLLRKTAEFVNKTNGLRMELESSQNSIASKQSSTIFTKL